MAGLSLLVLAAALRTGAGGLTGEQYAMMPRLFHLDGYERCLAAVGGVYCLGTFTLKPSHDDAIPLFDMMQKHSSGDHNFNHTLLHRGYCISSRCAHIQARSSPERFERCVSRSTRARHRLDARLLNLDYCEAAGAKAEPLDIVDYIFSGVVGILVLFNVVGTAYDVFRSGNVKPNQYLMSWSIRQNWNRLFAVHDDGDSRLSALKSVQGIRAFTLALVTLAHSMIVHHMSYIYNPEDIERGNSHWPSTIFHNGSVVVQGFFLLSSFLFAYNLLLVADDNNTILGLKMLPQCVLHRLIRTLPLHLFMVGLTGTWWARSSSGALWAPLVRRHAAACRAKWWTHALHLNNLLYPDDKCLIQSWFLAADMQLYIAIAALTLLLARRQRVAIKVLTALFLGSIVLNFCVAYYFHLKPILLLMNPEVIRSQYAGSASFTWLYAAAWGSLPAALLGALLAFLQRRLLAAARRPDSYPVFYIAYQLFLPALVVWVLGGHWLKEAPPLLVAGYAAVDRAGYALIGAVGLIGFFNNVDSIWKRFFEWRGWMPLGRMSLAVYLVHWNYNLTHIALRGTLSRVAVYEIGGHWHSVQFMTYATALPLHICIELPAQRFLQTLFFKNVPRLRQKSQ